MYKAWFYRILGFMGVLVVFTLFFKVAPKVPYLSDLAVLTRGETMIYCLLLTFTHMYFMESFRLDLLFAALTRQIAQTTASTKTNTSMVIMQGMTDSEKKNLAKTIAVTAAKVLDKEFMTERRFIQVFLFPILAIIIGLFALVR